MTAEVADFWQRAVQSLRTSEALIESDSDAAASRAYFAAFYAISAFFASRGERFTKHAAVERSVHRDLVKPGILPVEVGTGLLLAFEPPAYRRLWWSGPRTSRGRRDRGRTRTAHLGNRSEHRSRAPA